MKQRFTLWFVPRLIVVIHWLLRLTIRWQFVGNVYERDQEQRFMLAFWHSRVLMMPMAFVGWHGRMLISEHRDGAFIADAVALLGIQSARGSSTRGGARAALSMLRAAQRDGCDLGVTPDGPKGPAEVVKPGIAQLALKAGYPVLPVSYASRRHRRMRSWDRFYLPLPFCRGVVVYGDYIFPQQGESVESFTARIQQGMDEVTRRAECYFSEESA